MTDFDMPTASAGYPARGHWMIDRLMIDLGLTENQAAGIVGNLGFESGGFATLQEEEPAVAGSRGGYGWAQWTGSRRSAFETWCAVNRLSPASDEANYGYLLLELRTAYKNTIVELKKTTTLADAVFSVGQTYERPGGTTDTYLPGMMDRFMRANEVLDGGSPLAADPPYLDAVLALEEPERKLVQQGLAWAKLYDGKIDGIIGPLSRAALEANRKG